MLVEFSDVSLRFGSRVVLDKLSFRFEAPSLVALVGPSGSGKSSILAILGQVLQPSSGTYTVGPESHEPAWVFQSNPILQRRTVLDNVALGPVSKGCGRLESELRAMNALRAVGVANLHATKAFNLSGGEKQRVAVARCVATGSSLILADEPTAALDVANIELASTAFAAARSAGALVILATHDERVASRCDERLDLSEVRK